MTNHSVHVDKEGTTPISIVLYWKIFDFVQETVTSKIFFVFTNVEYTVPALHTNDGREYPWFWLCFYSLVFLPVHCARAMPISLPRKSFHVHSSHMTHDAFLIKICFFGFRDSFSSKIHEILQKIAKPKISCQ